MSVRKAYLKGTANSLLREWGLADKGWTFVWNKSKSCFGLCTYRPKTIALSSYLLPTITDESAVDTIKHEIAHALDFHDRGTSDHSKKWKRWAVKVGADPSRCKDHDNKEMTAKLANVSRYKLVCSNGHVFPSHRKKRMDSSCYECARIHNLTGYQEIFKLKQIKNEKQRQD